jgi:hypothetical protein
MIAGMLLITTCGGSDGPAPAPDTTLRIESRSATTQSGLSGSLVGARPSVRVTRGGAAAAGIVVTFEITAGDGILTGATPTTDANGIATIGSWKLGRNGSNRLSANAPGASGSPVTFEAVAADAEPPRLRYSFADSVNLGTSAAPQWVPAGIRGDGRARDGAPLPGNVGGVYQGDFCGANALMGRGDAFDEHDDMLFDPRRYYSDALPASCKPQRVYRVYRDGLDQPPAEIGPLSHGDLANKLAVGETRLFTMVFQAGAAGGAFRFIEDAARGSSAAAITRLPDIRDEIDRPVRQWRIESRGTHKADDFTINGTYYLPFMLTITEVPYPFPTYP